MEPSEIYLSGVMNSDACCVWQRERESDGEWNRKCKEREVQAFMS